METTPFILEGCGIQLVEAVPLCEVINAMRGRYSQSLAAEFVTRGSAKKHNILKFFWSRYAMDGNGYHVGYEEWCVSVPLIGAADIGWNNSPRLCWGEYVACLTSDKLRVKLEGHPDNEKGEDGYYAPDEDFGWQEWEALMREPLKELRLASRVFNPANRSWALKSPQCEIDFGCVDEKLGKGAKE